ncbi:pre-mRNA-splicing factor ISY1 [Mycena filopes]|nr:pre-mRNA-splicing factor ISY1 [Mycena filopes]
MARNQQKAQSMLSRFREAQAGSGRASGQPPMASALRECERWRGELLREISRKVAKIQDAGLSDYELRDLNDEINKQMREKRHWENQIVALGGANYRRNVAMLDDDGKQLSKYFGRAKELPGVRELFQSRKKDEDEENAALAYYKKFQNQTPAYYGDLDEAEPELLAFERAAQDAEWDEAVSELRTTLGLAADALVPRPATVAVAPPDGDVAMSDSDSNNAAQTHAQTAAAYIPFLTPAMLEAPKLPTPAETEAVLLALRKQALVEEYFGVEGE